MSFNNENGSEYFGTSTVTPELGWGTPLTKMNYIIGVGAFNGDYMEKILVSSDSFENGVSLESVTWGILNHANSQDLTQANISFTIHDFAGDIFKTYTEIQLRKWCFYFWPPMSHHSGGVATQPLVYFPDPDACSLEFSPTTGFTYTFVGKPQIRFGSSRYLGLPRELSIPWNPQPGKYISTFSDAIDDFILAYNAFVADNQLAQIDIKYDKSLMDTFKVTRTDANDSNKKIHMKQWTAKPNSTLSEALSDMFHQNFYKEEYVKTKPRVILDFMKKDENTGKMEFNLNIFDIKDSENLSIIPFCVGSDSTCKGSPFRASLTDVQFNAITKFLLDTNYTKSVNSTRDESATSNEIGSLKKETTEINHANNITVGNLEFNAPRLEKYRGDQTTFSQGLEQARSYLRKNLVADFTISLDLPYTYALHPQGNGGILLDANVGATSGSGINVKQGGELNYFWWTDATTSTLGLHPISGNYRINRITHTIGLTNNTVVELCNLHLD